MSIINYAARSHQLQGRLLRPGCGAARRRTSSTSTRSLPDGNKGKMISLATGDDRTFFFDFLPVSALGVRGFDHAFQLYTVPGQVYYNMTAQARAAGVDGVVFVADSQWDRLQDNVESYRNLDENLKRVRSQPGDDPPRAPVQQARPGPNVAPVDYMEFLLNRGERRVPTFEAVAVDGTGVFDTLNTVSRLVLVKEFGQVQEAGAMRVHDIVIHEADAVRIDAVLGRFLADSGCAAALLIDRSGQLLAETGVSRTLDTGSIGALAAGAFSATAALAQLAGRERVLGAVPRGRAGEHARLDGGRRDHPARDLRRAHDGRAWSACSPARRARPSAASSRRRASGRSGWGRWPRP